MSASRSFHDLAHEALLQTQEARVPVATQKQKLTLGIPREISLQENRIAITPQGVKQLIHAGYTVNVETNAGTESRYTNKEYEEAGANIEFVSANIYQCDVVIKVGFPTAEEISQMKEGLILFSALHMAMMKVEDLKQLMGKKVTAICFEYLLDDAGYFPVLQAMSEIAGSTAVLIAAEYLSNVNHGTGILLGGVAGLPPAEVVILGAGAVGNYAARAAIGLGAEVKVFDTSVYRLRRLQNSLGHRVFSSTANVDVVTQALSTADVAIGAVRAERGSTPCLVSDEMVMNMREGSVIVDVSIDQGGTFATSRITNHLHPVFEKYGVIHYCVPNIASRVARTASRALNIIFTDVLIDLIHSGSVKEYLWEQSGPRAGVYIYKGNITNKFLSTKYGLTYKPLDLLIASLL